MTCRRFFAGVFAIFIISGAGFAMPKPTRDFYVNDFANVLSASHKGAVLSRARGLSEQTGTQIVVVTVVSLEEQAIEEYANKLLNLWKIGDKRNNGVLFLIAPVERRAFIEVGYGLEGALTDGAVGQILDTYVLPHFRQDNFSQGILDGFGEILAAVSGEFTAPLPKTELKIFVGILYFIILFISIYWLIGGKSLFGLFGIVGIFARSRRHGGRPSSGRGGSSGGGGARRRW
jgi:uncharacterized protein